MNILFVCSRNQWRSPTAEALYRHHPDHTARSGGTAAAARHRGNARDIAWADLIAVMETEHKRQLAQRFADLLRRKRLLVLDIPDDYGYMDADLINAIQDSMAAAGL